MDKLAMYFFPSFTHVILGARSQDHNSQKKPAQVAHRSIPAPFHSLMQK
jgi:hypothetical protein